MNWKAAKAAAEQWIDKLQLGPIRGLPVDISGRGATLPHAGDDRIVVLRAAERVLVKRGATRVIMPQ